MKKNEMSLTEGDETILPEILETKSLKLAKAAYSFIGPTSVDSWSPDDVDKLETFDIRKYHDVVKQCRFFYRKDPIAGTVINKMTEIGITPIIFERGKLSENEIRIFEAIKDDLQNFAESCALEYLISGLVVPEIRYESVGKEFIFDLGVKKYSTLTLPVSMWLRDPTTIKIQSTMVMDKPSYYVVLPKELVDFILNDGKYNDGNRDEKLWHDLNTLYPEFVFQVKAGNKEILLDNDLIIRRKVQTDTAYPTPFLFGSLEAMKHKRNIRRMDYSIASRVQSAIQLIKVGSDQFPVTEEDADIFEDLKSQMAWRNTSQKNLERIFQLFVNHTVDISWVFPETDALLSESKYREVNQDIFFGLGFPRILTTGETERTQTSDPELAAISPVKTLKNMQSKILFIIKGIVKEVAILNGLKSLPIVRFDNINLYSFRNFVEGMGALYDSGNISRTSYDAAFGFEWEEEIKQKSREKDTLEVLGVEEFAPQPFSPQPGKPGDNTQKTEKTPQETTKTE